MPELNNKKANILRITKSDQYKTIDELLKRSQPNSIYYSLLVLSTFIIASGLLLDNAFIVIGGMLVTPVLTPVLVLGLGFATGELGPIKQEGILLAKSFFIIALGSALLAFVFGTPQFSTIFDNTIRTAALYFIVAIAAGIAATFAWTRREVAEVLPGIAIAVSLVPPLSLIGIGLSSWHLDFVRFYFSVFLFNLLGVVMGSLIAFSLLKFYRAEKKVQSETSQEN